MSAVATPATNQMHVSTTIDPLNREFPAAASRLVWRIVRASNIDLPSCEFRAAASRLVGRIVRASCMPIGQKAIFLSPHRFRNLKHF